MPPPIDQTSSKIYFRTGSLTTVAAALGSASVDLVEMIIQADPDNSADILLGDATSQGWRLEPGDVQPFPVSNPALIYGKASTGTATYALFGRYGE